MPVVAGFDGFSDFHRGDAWQVVVLSLGLIAFDQIKKLRLKHEDLAMDSMLSTLPTLSSKMMQKPPLLCR